MVRVLLTTLVVAWVGSADAAPKRKVKVVTEPAGATVYITSTEEGPACTPTPCVINVPVGETSIVIDLKDHNRAYENVIVPKRGKVTDVKYTLTPAMGTIVVAGPPGASVMIDDVDQGKAPTSVEVPAEGHHVVIILKGKTIYDDYVEVVAGIETTVEPAKKIAAISGGGGGGGGEGGEGGEGGDDGELEGGEITKKVTPASSRDRYVSVAAAVDVSFRDFTYAGTAAMPVTKGTLRNEVEKGQVLMGPAIELWLGSMAGIRFLRGLSILARYQYGVNKQRVEASGLMKAANTFWQSMELSLRHRWTFAQRVTVELGGGYVRDQFQFEAVDVDLLKFPHVDYQAFRLGARVSLLVPMSSGVIEPFLTFENRSVSSGGANFEDRFTEARPSGYRASAGIAARFGNITGRLEGAATQYSWEIVADPMSDRRASSASDAIRQIGLSVGYQY